MFSCVTLFVAYLVVKGPKALFRNAFYIIYLLQSVADVSDYFTVQWLIRLPQYNVLPVDIVKPAGAFLFFATAYFQFFQCLSHTAIGLNRYTCMLDPTRHTLIWSGRLLTTIIAVLFVTPVFAAGVRLWFQIEVVRDGVGYGLANTDYGTDLASGIRPVASVTLALTTCALSAVFEFHAVILYRRLSVKQKRAQRDDFRLLIYAIIGLVSQALMAAIWFTSHVVGMHSAVGQVIVKASLPYVIDLLSLSGPLCLLVTSKTVRKRYFEFFGFKGSSSVVTVSTAPPSQHSDNTVFATRRASMLMSPR